MQKIPTVFVRDAENMRYVLDQVNPSCEWVLEGEGTPTRKYDGTCVMFDGKAWWARREVKPGKTAPAGFVAVETDPITEKTVGWEPIAQSAFAKYHAEAVACREDAIADGQKAEPWPVGTYELVGPKINGNPEQEDEHFLILHASAEESFVPIRTFDGIREQVLALRAMDGCEGIVFHHRDGRMAKIKARDFR